MNCLGVTNDKFPEPIALVGIGCRLPEGIRNHEEFWEFLQKNEQSITELPLERLRLIAGKRRFGDNQFKNLPNAAYLNEVDKFDEEFFKISPREAASIDPQQRLLLETAWETLEDAGWTFEEMCGSRTGVFVGAMGCDYLSLHIENTDFSPYSPLGLDTSLLANRISHFLGLQGPSLTVNTASSASLAAIHLAVNSLRSGESEKALVGGVNLILNLRVSDSLLKMGVISPTGQAKAFTNDANGYVRGEGIVCIALKTLSRALRDRDRIYCLILGSGINNNGFNRGIASPKSDAQRQLLDDVYKQAEITPADVQYIEAHGSGTEAGDKAELTALSEYFGNRNGTNSALMIGTVKNNLGHLEAAAGITGFVKTALGLYHGSFPVSRFDGKAVIDGGNSCLSLSSDAIDWKNGEKGRIAGVNSFGFGGTNCHIIVGDSDSVKTRFHFAETNEEISRTFDERIEEKTSDNGKKLRLIPISARSPKALIQFAAVAAADLWVNSLDLKDWAYTASWRRTHHFYRKAFLADSCRSLCEQLADFAESTHESAKRFSEKPSNVVLWLDDDESGLDLPLIEKLRSDSYFTNRFSEASQFFKERFGVSLELYFAQSNELPTDLRAIAEAVLYWIQTASLLDKAKSSGLRFSFIISEGIGEIIEKNLKNEISDRETAEKIADWKTKRNKIILPDSSVSLPKKYYQLLNEQIAEESILLFVSTEKSANFNLPHEIVSLQNSDLSVEKGILSALGKLYEKGAEIDWQSVFEGEESVKLVRLPFYQWQRKSHWLGNETNAEMDEFYRFAESFSTVDESALILPLDDYSIAPVKDSETVEIAEILETFETEAECLAVIEDYLCTLIANSLGRQKSEIDATVSLLYLGVESLIALELEHAIETDCKISVNLGHQLGETNLKQLAELISSQIIFVKKQKSEFTADLNPAVSAGWEIKRL